MNKYYVADLGHRLAKNGPSELVSVQFSRRPPTFGLLQLYCPSPEEGKLARELAADEAQREPGGTLENERTTEGENGPANGQVLCLSCLNLSENMAKFETLREVQLEPATRFVCFGLLDSSQVLIEGSVSSLSVEQQMQANCLLLSDEGRLFACSLLDGHLELVLDCAKHGEAEGIQKGASETFSHLALQRAAQSSVAIVRQRNRLQASAPASRHAAADLLNYCCQFYAHILSERSYRCFCVRVRIKQQQQQQTTRPVAASNLEYDCQLMGRFALGAERVNLAQVVPPFESRPHVVLLKRTDQSWLVVRDSKCIHRIGANELLVRCRSPDGARCTFIQSLQDQQTAIMVKLHFETGQVTAHSLLVAEEEATGDEGSADEAEADVERAICSELSTASTSRAARDPDRLLPREPSFELELCWTLDLRREFESLRSLDDCSDEEGDDHGDGSEKIAESKSARAVGCLCPFWSQDQIHQRQTSGGNGASSSGIRTLPWPKFLVLAYKCHLLLFTFEHQTELPFSVVYDRAFMQMHSQDSLQDAGQEIASSTQAKPKTPASPNLLGDESMRSVDPRAKPELVHNFKLIGPHPSDALFNFLFLEEADFYVKNLCQLQQLGLVVATSSRGHVLAFQITSDKISSQKSTLYQQQLAEVLASSSLLSDAIDKLERANRALRKNIESIESQQVSMGDSSSALSAVSTMLEFAEDEEQQQQQVPARDPLARQHQLYLQQQREQRRFLTSLDRLIRVRLNEYDANSLANAKTCQYELSIGWPELVDVSAIFIICDVSNCVLLRPGDLLANKHVKTIRSNQDESLIPKSFFDDDEQDKSESQSSCTWVSIELRNRDRAESVSLSLPMLVFDSVKLGQIEVFFNLNAPHGGHPRQQQQLAGQFHHKSTSSQSRNWRILAAASELAINHYIRHSRSSSAGPSLEPAVGLFKKSLPIIPLQSYKFSGTFACSTSSQQRSHRGLSMEPEGSGSERPVLELELSSSFRSEQLDADGSSEGANVEWQTVASWLAECLEHRQWLQVVADKFHGLTETSSAASGRSIGLKFASPFTHCSIEVELLVIPMTDDKVKQGMKLKLKSEDFIAFDLIRRHLLNRATDNSIKLDVQRCSTVGVQHLRLLLSLQKANIEAARRDEATFSTERSARHSSAPYCTADRVELLVESLLGETNQCDLSKLCPDLALSEHKQLARSWLERTLRKDIEMMLQSEEMELRKQKSTFTDSNREPGQSNEFSLKQNPTLAIVAAFTLKALLNFDRNHTSEPSSSSTTKRSMHQRLLKIIKEGRDYERNFGELVLHEWKTKKTEAH